MFDETDRFEKFSRLLSALYGGLTADTPWDDFLRGLASYLDATYGSLLLTAPGAATPGKMMTPDADQRVAEDYADNYVLSDPFIGLPEGKVVAFADFLKDRPIEGTDFYEFLAATSDQILGVDLTLQSGFQARVRVFRDKSHPAFTLAEVQAFQAVVPHIRHALGLFERLEAIGAEQGVYHSAIEQMAVATIILDHSGNILRTNVVADRLLAENDGIGIHDGQLHFHSRAIRKAITDALRALEPGLATENATKAHAPAALRFRIERPSGTRDLALVVKPVSGMAYMRGGKGAALALFISNPEQEAQVSPEAIRDLFQLTPMEARLAAALAGGCSLVEAAETLGIAHNTARSHLRSIFDKTGARRQSQLVHLLHSILPN